MDVDGFTYRNDGAVLLFKFSLFFCPFVLFVVILFFLTGNFCVIAGNQALMGSLFPRKSSQLLLFFAAAVGLINVRNNLWFNFSLPSFE